MAYSKEQIESVFKEIISDIERGSSLRASLRKEGRPDSTTFYKWIDEDKGKSVQYARAAEERIDVRFESIEKDYLEEPQRDPQTGKIDTGWVQLQRLKIDSKKWELSKLSPKKYGDKLDVTSDGDKIQNVNPILEVKIIKPDEE